MDQDKSKMETMLRSILDEILEFKLTAILSSILDAKLRTYEESMSFFNTSFESMKDKINGLEKQTNTLTRENERLRSDSANLRKEIGDLKSALEEQAQYTRRECLEIRGVPALQGEDTNEIVKKIGSLIDADVNDTDISISHRIPLSSNGESASTPSTPRVRHPAIVVKFTNRRIRDRFYKARPKLKSCNISDIGLGRFGADKIYIQESLTESKRKLFKKCLKFRKDHNYKFIWSHYGVIYLRRNEHTSALRITSERDLEGLHPRLSASESTSNPSTDEAMGTQSS